MMTRFLLVPAFLILLPATGSPQELGDAAARERAKKAKAAPPAKAAPAFSNDDLASEKEKKRKKEEAEARGEKPEPEPPPEGAPAQEGPAVDGRKRLSDPDKAKDRAREAARDGVAPEGAQDGNDDQAERSAQEAIWRGRFETARKTIRDLESQSASIQARLEELRARISPMNPQQEQDVNKLLEIQQQITGVEAELGSAGASLKSARGELVALEETARQAGVSPGWLRPPQ
jgi:chromosome segregation ATPase